MNPEQIKELCEQAYSQIKQAEEALIQLRASCKHEKTSKRIYSWRPGHYRNAEVCDYCGTPIKFLDGVESVVTTAQND